MDIFNKKKLKEKENEVAALQKVKDAEITALKDEVNACQSKLESYRQKIIELNESVSSLSQNLEKEKLESVFQLNNQASEYQAEFKAFLLLNRKATIDYTGLNLLQSAAQHATNDHTYEALIKINHESARDWNQNKKREFTLNLTQIMALKLVSMELIKHYSLVKFDTINNFTTNRYQMDFDSRNNGVHFLFNSIFKPEELVRKMYLIPPRLYNVDGPISRYKVRFTRTNFAYDTNSVHLLFERKY